MTWGRGSTRASRKLRARILQDKPLCHLNYPGCTLVATEDDHVTPLSQGGTDHPSNHAGACSHCHNIKSRHEAAQGRARKSRTRPTTTHPGTPGG